MLFLMNWLPPALTAVTIAHQVQPIAHQVQPARSAGFG